MINPYGRRKVDKDKGLATKTCKIFHGDTCNVGVLGVWVGGEGGGMRRKRHQTRSKIINRFSAEH